jgi:hypothetical protein
MKIKHQLLESRAAEIGITVEELMLLAKYKGYVDNDEHLTAVGINSELFNVETHDLTSPIHVTTEYITYKCLAFLKPIIFHFKISDGSKIIGIDSLAIRLGFKDTNAMMQDGKMQETLKCIRIQIKTDPFKMDNINGLNDIYFNMKAWEVTFGKFDLDHWNDTTIENISSMYLM